MKGRKLVVRKVLLGIVLVLLAAGITVFIKESLDTQDPESALPLITVRYNDGEMSAQNIYRAGYQWSFFTTVEDWQAPDLAPEDLPITPVEIQPGTPLEMSFSSTPSSLRIWRAAGRYSSDFLELSCPISGEFSAPANPGIYLYRAVASWGHRGEIQYYFALSVIG
ncbi:MAG: hypothetical protein RSC00_01115 [Ruthenibacterium sp.]